LSLLEFEMLLSFPLIRAWQKLISNESWSEKVAPKVENQKHDLDFMLQVFTYIRKI